MDKPGVRFPNKNLVLGILVLIVGGVLLIWRMGSLPSFQALWPLPVLLLGLVFLYRVFLSGKSRRYILPGMVLSLAGLFFLLQDTVLPQRSLAKVWPAFMFIIGLSLLPYGFVKKGNARTAIVIPAFGLIGLGFIFFPFSLGWVKESFTDFVLTWWPGLLLLTGGLLILTHFIHRRDRNTRNRRIKTNKKKNPQIDRGESLKITRT